METEQQLPPSFSRGRRWRIGFSVVVGFLALLAIVVMVNYISHNFFFRRLFLSSHSSVQLSGQSLALLRSVTNQIKVTLYYDREDELYPTISALVNEYRLANPKLAVETVDYRANPADAQKIKSRYQLDGPNDRNLVIFDCDGRVKMISGDGLMETRKERVAGSRELEFRNRPVQFNGEVMCSAMLLAVTSQKPLRACYLMGHGEPSPGESEKEEGYAKFAVAVMQNYIQLEPLSLLGTNTLPDHCSVLIIASPKTTLRDDELAKISRYLDAGGRVFALFGYETVNKDLGLEHLLAKWGVNVGSNIIADPENTHSGPDVEVKSFSDHKVVNALRNASIHVVYPRQISRIDISSAADAPRIEEIARTGEHSTLLTDTNVPPQAYPVAVAVEKGAVAGVAGGRTTRIVVIGDATAFNNQMLVSAANRDFVRLSLNWLVDRPQLLDQLGPRPATEFMMLMTHKQWISASLILLFGLPGVTLFLGSLVWLRRRK
ncbi:MAG: hypothetical protein RLY20_1530 [Verrucomicrobiota bacterium]|jgi:ABC-2 type transport system permease protein